MFIKWQDILVGSSANTFVVLYQYTIPPAAPHLKATFFQLLFVLCGGAVVSVRAPSWRERPSDDVGVALVVARRSVLATGRYIVRCDKGNRRCCVYRQFMRRARAQNEGGSRVQQSWIEGITFCNQEVTGFGSGSLPIPNIAAFVPAWENLYIYKKLSTVDRRFWTDWGSWIMDRFNRTSEFT